MAENKNTTTQSNQPKHDTHDSREEETMDYGTREVNPNADPNEEVTPHNTQAPIDDEAKHRQDDVLSANHIDQGFPANLVPRTDEERKQMEEAGLIDEADTSR